jgi:hypothetical protein
MAARYVVVGQLVRGAEQPFTDKYGTQFAYRCFGVTALELGWTCKQEIPPQLLRDKDGIITCGEKAAQWLHFLVNGDVPVLDLPSPQYFLTRSSEAEIATVYESVREFVENQNQQDQEG